MADIMFDYDEPVYPWIATAHRLCQRAGITNGKAVTTWEPHESYGCSRDDVWEVLLAATVSGELYNQAPDPAVLRQMARLRGYGHRIHIVTARGCHGQYQEEIQAYTRENVRAWGVPFDSLTFAKDKVAEGPFDYVLDDKPATVEAFWRADYDGTKRPPKCMAFLMDACHNQSVVGLPRVKSVLEFADLVVAESV